MKKIAIFLPAMVLCITACLEKPLVDDDKANKPLAELRSSELFWEMKVDVENYPNAKALLVFDGSYLSLLYIQNDRLMSDVVERYQATLNGNILTIYHPELPNSLISTITLSKNHDFENNSFLSISSVDLTNAGEAVSGFGCWACCQACLYVHKQLDIEELNIICCFWYSNCEC